MAVAPPTTTFSPRINHSLSVLQLLIIMVPEETFDGELSQHMALRRINGSAASAAASAASLGIRRGGAFFFQ
jgi:hypothetical protein